MFSSCCRHKKHRSNQSLSGRVHWFSSNFCVLLFFPRQTWRSKFWTIWNFVQSSFLPQSMIAALPINYWLIYGFKVLNAVFFQSTDSANFHVYVNELSFSFPRVLYDFWNGTRFLFAKDLFPDKLKNFNGRVLRATSFNFPPYTYQAECSHWSTYFKILCSMYSIVAGGTWLLFHKDTMKRTEFLVLSRVFLFGIRELETAT